MGKPVEQAPEKLVSQINELEDEIKRLTKELQDREEALQWADEIATLYQKAIQRHREGRRRKYAGKGYYYQGTPDDKRLWAVLQEAGKEPPTEKQS